MDAKHPHADTRLAKFLRKRILELRPKKKQREIAAEAGYRNPNMISMLKSGASKLALDRVPALAQALDTDPRLLFLMAFEQSGNETKARTVEQVFTAIVTENEAVWLAEIRDASGHTDPALTTRARSALRAIFGK